MAELGGLRPLQFVLLSRGQLRRGVVQWQDGAAPDLPQAAQLCHQVE